MTFHAAGTIFRRILGVGRKKAYWGVFRMAAVSPQTSTSAQPDLDAENLFRLHARFVAAFLSRLGVGRDDLDDWVQEVFLVAHRRGGYVAGQAKPTTWLAAIALRIAMKAREARARRPRAALDDVAAESVPSNANPFDALAAQQRLQWLLNRLEPEQRAVFILFEIEGAACDDIAAALQVPVGTVYSRLHAARREWNESYQRLEAIERSLRPFRGGAS
jgi:RNA polymerase sigma-70 factor, ECF subfamily